MAMTKREVDALVVRVMRERKKFTGMRGMDQTDIGWQYADEFIARTKRKHLKRAPFVEAAAD